MIALTLGYNITYRQILKIRSLIMNNLHYFAWGLTLNCLTLAGCNVNEQSPDSLVISTWNTEHLARQLNSGCKARSESDYQHLRSYAKSTKADIIALQEVESKEAVARVFPASEWQIVMSDRSDSPTYDCRGSQQTSTQQKTAYAIKNHINIDDVKQLAMLSEPRMGLRNGLQVTVSYNDNKVNLINVHLKSGCFVADYRADNKQSCQVFSQQATALKQYLMTQDLATQNWIVLGDFNHRLAEKNNYFRHELIANQDNDTGSYQPAQKLINTTDGYKGCHPKYPAPIDHILISHPLKDAYIDESLTFHHFDNMQPENMLSDHCALSINFSF